MKNKLSTFLKYSASLMAITSSFSVYANAPSYGLIPSFSNSSQISESCNSIVDIDLNIKNIDNSDLIIKNIEFSKIIDGLSGLELNSKLSFNKDSKFASLLKKDDKNTSKISLKLPKQDGFYKEVVRISWEHKDGHEKGLVIPETIYGEGILYYQVKNGCFSLVDSKTYEDATSIKDFFNVMENGKIKNINATKGAIVNNNGIIDSDFMVAEKIIDLENSNQVLPDDVEEENENSALDSVLNLSYCFNLSYLDNFTTIPINTSGMDWTRPYGDGKAVAMNGLVVSLYDRDTETEDDFIASYYLKYSSRTGLTCVNFSWDQTEHGENYPDVYLNTSYSVASASSYKNKASLCSSDDNSSGADCSDDHKYTVTWRDFYTNDLQEGTTVNKYFTFSNDATNVLNQRAMVMAGMQKFLQSFESFNMTGNLNAWWNGSKCTTEDGTPWPCSYDDNWLTLTEGTYQRWDVSPHESGHCYEKQLFEQTGLYGSSCPSPHYLTGVANDACATREGYAEFVSVASWYVDPDSATAPILTGYNIESGSAPADNCSDNSKIELQVAKTLWDVIDARNDGSDTFNGGRFEVAYGFDLFPDGSSNNQDKESGDDGCNLWDFHVNSKWSSSYQTGINNAMSQNQTNCQSKN